MGCRPARGMISWLCLLVVALSPAAARAQRQQIPFSDEAVERAIENAKKYLWSQYDERLGHWKEPPLPANRATRSYHGGYSSLALYGLLSAGESYQEPRVKRALKWLATVPMNATYCLGLRCQVWLALPRAQGRRLLAKDVQQLIKSIYRPAKPPVDFKKQCRFGSYTYLSDGTPRGGDHSNTQFGILGVWAGARANLEVPMWYWQLVYKHFESVQNPDGGWGYGYKFGGVAGSSKGTMSAAGLASTFVAFDKLHAAKFVKCGANPIVAPLQKALDWFDKNYHPGQSVGGGPYHYYMYGVERVGLASGYKYFGKKDWYKLGAARLVNSQRGGGWGNVVNTTFSLLFLVRGRAPVLFNRLEYNGDWNNRPRALANLMRWTGQKFEREVNWQIINLKAPVEEWHDAPILLITGSKAPTFSDAEVDKLREFVWQGGMIFSVAECKQQGQAFDAGMRKVYQRLFGDYELKRLPPNHRLYSAPFRIQRRVPLWGISNGIRFLAMHCTDDLPLGWQTDATSTQPQAFQLPINMVFYATDKASLRHRGTSTWPEAGKSVVPLRTASVARVKHNGNWDPEPLAWKRFAMLMGQHWQTRLTPETVSLADLSGTRHPVAAITGTTRLTLTAGQKDALKSYVAGGGTVIIDAAGGSAAFFDSAVEMLRELFGAAALARLPSFSPVYQLPGMEMGPIRYRRAARKRAGHTRAARIMGVTLNGRVAVFLSREDLTSGLVGYPSLTCLGYSPGTAKAPGSAVQLMRNMVLYGNQVRKARTEASSQPVAAK